MKSGSLLTASSSTARNIRSVSTSVTTFIEATATSTLSSSVSTISASTTIGASFATSTSIPTPVPFPDNSVSTSGIAVAVVFGSALFISACLLVFYKLRSIRRLQKGEHDNENLISEAENGTPYCPVSPVTSANGKDHGDIVPGTFIHTPDRPLARLQSRKSIISGSYPLSYTEFSNFLPRPSMSSAESSPQTPQFLPILLERNQIHALSSPRLSPSTFQPPPTTPRSPSAHSPLNRFSAQDASVKRSSPLRIHLPHISSYRPRRSSPLGSTRPLSLNSSAAILMQNPATQGRSLSEVSPGLDPNYPYPMTPDQVGDGREVSS